MADGQILIKVDAKQLQRLVNTTNQVNKAFKRTSGSAKNLSNVAGNLGSRLGFVAFQFTFMAGVAGRALQDLGRRMQDFVEEGSKDFSAIGRAISRSGFDIASTLGEDVEAVTLLNNAIRTFGSGVTIFNTKEVAEAFNAVGRATTFVGTTLERAQQQIILTRNVLNLMTIEEQGAEAAAINLIKTLKQFGLATTDAAHAADVLVAVNNQSSITLDGLVRSLGFAGQQARQFGISFEDTSVILGVIQDRLGVLNGGPGRNFSILLESLSDTGTSLNTTLESFGIHIRDAKGNLNPFNEILTQTKKALDATGGAGTLANEVILDQISTTSRGSRALLALVQGFDELQLSLEAVAQSGGLAADLAERFGELPEERITRLKNALNSLRIEFVGGLAPALGQLTDEFRSIATDTNVQQFFIELGSAISTTVMPAIQSATKLLKFFASALGKNKILLKVVTGLFIGLVGVLGTLFIVGTLGALISVMASSIARLATSTAFLTVINSVFVRSLLKILVVAAGVFLILKAVDGIIGIFKDGIEAAEIPLLAFNVGLAALGVILTALPFVGLKGLLAIPARLAAALAGTLAAGSLLTQAKIFGQGLGAAASGGFGSIVTGAKGITGKMLGAFQSLGKAGIIGAIIAAVAVTGILIAQELDKRVQNAKVFKDGLVTWWDEAGFQFKAAIASTIFAIGEFFVNLWRDIIKGGQFALEAIGKEFAKVQRAFEKLSKFDFKGALEDILSIGADLNFDAIATGFAETFNNKLLAENRIKEIAAKLFEREGQDFLNTDDIFDRPEFQQILAATKATDIISPSDIVELVNQALGLDAFDPVTGEALMEVLTEQIIAATDSVAINDEVNLSLSEYNETLAGLVDSGEFTQEQVDALLESGKSLEKSQTKLNLANDILGGTTDAHRELEATGNTIINEGNEKGKSLNELFTTNIKLITLNNVVLSQINNILNSQYIPIVIQQMQQLLLVEGELNLLESDLSQLRQAIRDLTSRISRTRIIFKTNAEGVVTDFKLVGGVTKSEASKGFNFFDSGGIVTGPTKAVIGESGPEAVIPLDRLSSIVGNGGTSVGDINITIEGNADSDTVQEIADAVEDVINNNIRNKPLLL